jgi:uncharacterized membrane protein
MIATAMSANVFFWIIPGQRKVVAAMTSGESYDANALAIHGKRGKQRSVHNTYFTLPVIFAMLSNHYSFLYTHEHRWLLLFVMMLAGALIRQFFVQRHGYHLGRAANPWPFAAVGVVLLLGVIVALRPAPPKASAAPALPVSFAQVQGLVGQHCLACHGAQVQMKNVRLDSPELIKQNAQNMYQQVVVTKQMPMGNTTGLTEEDRALFGRWFQAGAQLD